MSIDDCVALICAAEPILVLAFALGIIRNASLHIVSSPDEPFRQRLLHLSIILISSLLCIASLHRILVKWGWHKAIKELLWGKKPETKHAQKDIVLITGGAGGLGHKIAQIYAARGTKVVLWDILDHQSDRVQQVIGQGNIFYYQCDIGITAMIIEIWDKMVSEVGTPTVVINNAALVHPGPIIDLENSQIDEVFRVNTISHFTLTKLFLYGLDSHESRHAQVDLGMIKSSKHQQHQQQRHGSGCIVTVASVLGQIGAARLSAYCASKAALLAFHQSMAAELRQYAPNIACILVAPGQLDTALFRSVQMSGWLRNFLGPVVLADNLAQQIVRKIGSRHGGEIREPFFARWIVLLDIMPAWLKSHMISLAGIHDAIG